MMFCSDASSNRKAGDYVKAEHVNPFIISICKIMKDMCMIDLKIGKPSMSTGTYAKDASIIRLGLVGALRGEVLLNIDHSTAIGIVSKMVMMPVEAIDELGQSAISELGNMVAGNAATVFSNKDILIDITPPSYSVGADYQPDVPQVFRIPFTCEAGGITVDVFIEE